MVKGQNVQNLILGCPFPGIYQGGDLCHQVPVGRDYPFGLACRTAGIQDHCPPIHPHLGKRTDPGFESL